MSASLVGSEMCIRDRASTYWVVMTGFLFTWLVAQLLTVGINWVLRETMGCLLYTSDAADDM
eukprot:2539722-Alexandrium_andersonii.AAC.1